MITGSKTGDVRTSPKNIKGDFMDPTNYGANEFTVEELEELFRDDEPEQATPPATTTEENPQSTENTDTGAEDDSVNTTKAFAKRLRESTDKARREEREAIAKSLGYASYDDMQKKREQQIMNDNGLNPEDVQPVVEQIVSQRLANDPRMQELETLRARQVQEFGKRELAEITKLTGGKITSLAQLPREVIELWKTKGSLKSAYLELEGEKLINTIRSEQSKGSTSHMNTHSGSASNSVTERPLTADEKRMYKFFNPNMTDEQLNKMTTKI